MDIIIDNRVCDICPQSRIGNEASEGMLIINSDRMSKLSVCLDAAHAYLLSEKEALSIIEHHILEDERLTLKDMASNFLGRELR